MIRMVRRRKSAITVGKYVVLALDCYRAYFAQSCRDKSCSTFVNLGASDLSVRLLMRFSPLPPSGLAYSVKPIW